MLRIPLILSICLITIIAQCQVKQFFQPIDFSHLKTNDTFSLVIQNTDTAPVEFYPLTVYDTDSSFLFESNSSFLNYIQSAGGQIAQIQRLAYFLKSDRFVNDFLVFNDSNPELRKKKGSVPMFFLGSSQEQCENFRSFAISSLISTGAFSKDSIFNVGLANHQLAECIINGDSVLLDFDPDEPIFLNKLPNGKYFSAQDILTYPNNDDSMYTYTDPVTGVCRPLMFLGYNPTVSDSLTKIHSLIGSYNNLFTSGIEYSPADDVITYKDSGTWKLPPGSSLEWHWQAPVVLTPAQMTVAEGSLNAQDASYTQIISALTNATGLDSASIANALVKNNLLLGDTTPTGVVLDRTYEKANTLDLYVNTSDSAVIIGQDLKLPFWIHSISTDQPLTIGDTTFPAGNSCMWLWNEKSQLDSDGFAPGDLTSVPNPGKGAVEYLQSGLIPAHCHVHMSLYYNERIYAIPGGLRAHMITNNFSSLVINGQQEQQVTTGVSYLSVQALSVYPNPSNGNLTIETGVALLNQPLEVYNSIGQLCLSSTVVNTRQSISLAGFASGLYTIKIGSSCQKFVKI